METKGYAGKILKVDLSDGSIATHLSTLFPPLRNIRQELDRRYTVLAIGPAGENLVRDASVIANKYSAYARTGMGPVMGSKNLKAIAVYGSQGVAIVHPRRWFMELVDKVCADIADLLAERFHKYGKGLVHLEAVAKARGSRQNKTSCFWQPAFCR